VLVYLLLTANTLGAVALLALALISGKGDTAGKFSTFRWYVLVSALLNLLYVTLRGLSSIAGVMPVRTAALAYITTYNVSILILSALVFLLVHDLYREATVHLPGMGSLGSLIFYGSVVISAIMAVGVVFSPHLGYASIPLALFQIERCSYILVLCLFTFFAFTAQKLGMVYGSRVFGITFGMAILATNRLVANAMSAYFLAYTNKRLTVDIVSEFVQIGVVALWMVYFLKAEPERPARMTAVIRGPSSRSRLRPEMLMM
jgi:hypothetical protein